MSLKSKVIISFLCVFLSYLCGNLLIHRLVIFPSFLNLENEEVRKDAERAVQAISRELEHLNTMCHDWAACDDTYNFAATHSTEYIETNLPDRIFRDARLNLLYYYDKERQLLYGQIRESETYRPTNLEIFQKGPISKDHSLLAYNNENRPLKDMAVTGLVMTAKGPMLIVSRPILDNRNEGPIGGTIIMGRFLDQALVKTIAEQIRVSLKIYPIQGSSLPASLQKTVAQIQPQSPFLIDRKAPDSLQCFTVLSDISGQPALLLSAEIPKKISAMGSDAIGYAWLVDTSAAVAVLLVMLFMLHRTVLGPVKRLSEHVLSIGSSRDLSKRLSMPKTDEIGKLGHIFDDMVAQLDEAVSHLTISEEMYRLITEHSLSLILLIQDEKLIYANNKAIEMSGYRQEELKEKKVRHLIHPDDLYRLNDLQQASPSEDCCEMRYLTQSGQTRWVEMLAVPINYNDKPSILMHGIDITDKKKVQTEQKELETRLQRAEKMEAIGAIVGGVAHDLNNILSGLVTYPELILLQLPKDSPFRKALSTIQQSGKKAEAIVQDLLTLSRRGVAVSENVNLNDLVESYLDSPEHHKIMSYNPNVQVSSYLEENLLRIVGSPVHLSKTLMNLVSNAVESIDSSGTIHIATENCYIDRPIKGYDSIKEGDYIRLSVLDTGGGISEADKEKIFEPFYTKKVMGRSGTGLGLAVVWATMKDHKGYIHLESEPGKGTCFFLYFPATRNIVHKASPALSMDQFKGNNETILVVDDIAEQREIASEMLKILGYRPATVPSGESALEYLAHNQVDLILLDMIMDPGIDGLETYRRILMMRPDQKVIIVSGYSETDRVREMINLGAGQYIKKPYILEKIGLAIRHELEKTA